MENTSKKVDYQKTLNLPQTAFPMKAGLVEKEPKMLEVWRKNDIYKRIREKNKGRPFFILHDGPPYANGHIHLGHALNKILKDIIVKYKTMKGFDAWYIPGWDCHGLPIEHQLLKDMKAKRDDFDTLVFRKKAHEYAMKFVAVQREEFRRLGVFGQWEEPYLTLNPLYEYWILKYLGLLTQKGFVYRSLKPVNWCFSCETALAEAEVEYEDHTSAAVYVKFSVNNPGVLGLSAEKKVSLLIWTTTPWTLLANVAVAVHPGFDYALCDMGQEIFIIERTRCSPVLGNKLVRGTVKGNVLVKLFYTHPFGKLQDCPVVTADYVTSQDGTGLVHTAPGHGQEDFQTGLKYHLPVEMPVNAKGVFTEKGAQFEGQHVFKANEAIIADLQERGLLVRQENLQHSYPHCWRCKHPVIFRATEQWFLSIDHNDLRRQLQKIIQEKVEWIPSAGRQRIEGMIASRPDWCLSRQRLWGVPIPALVCKGCGDKQKLFVEVIDHVADSVKKHGSDVWFEWPLEKLLPSGFHCPDCGGHDFQKAHDILDVWFDSGVSHKAVLDEMMRIKQAADLYVEGSDQHRGWFQSSLIPSVAVEGAAPYKGVLTHGFVVDGQGRKMSKSLGNVMSPQQIMDTHGAEILRLWVSSSSYHEDVRISQEIIDRLVDAYRKIRNTLRYVLGNLHNFDAKHHVLPYEELLAFDRWALNRLALTIQMSDQGYKDYDFVQVFKTIYRFCNEDLSSIYLDILKDRLYTCPAYSKQRLSAQTVLYYIFDSLIRILAPIVPFCAEEALAYAPWSKAQKDLSVHMLSWPLVLKEWLSPASEEAFGRLLKMRDFVLKALDEQRKQGKIGSGLEAKVVLTTSSETDYQYFNSFGSERASIFIVSEAQVKQVKEVKPGLSDDFKLMTLEVYPADGIKCARCWNWRLDVGINVQHPQLCGRCVQVVEEIQM